ncbi:hypothetical protein ABL78_4734 [Leptomonas seymouri]|uniref:Cyclic nucleotide-binding domain-containing protein n=1 Tax=Leptomonas seymouri TaxID=5684 RepID=A0A0N1I352_LEPSE|nr:hypothetical protein ABL78_4734 [Leptomonas seymouri]|eukprot:KPI86221.1 hypothetical protein ABL78_4734 [Leptomonas seymouri]
MPADDSISVKLPSGQQMDHLKLQNVVQEQIHTIALQVLQLLFVPLVQRYRLRKARLKLQRQYLAEQTSAEEVEAAAVNALHYVSFLDAATRDLSTSPSTAAGGAPIPSSILGHDGSARANFSLSSPVFSFIGDSPIGVKISEQVRAAMESNLVHLVAYLQDEILEWEMEPASEVLVLLAGTVERSGSAVTVSRAMSASPFVAGGGVGAVPGVRRQSTVPVLVPSRRGSLSCGRPASNSLIGSVPMQPNASANASFAATARNLLRRASSGASVEVQFNALGDGDVQLLSAPQVFGELACLGAFPYCATLSVTSPTALLLRIPKEVYCQMVSVCVPEEGQRRLLVEALQMRERLMPHYAPLTSARILLCPLLKHLRQEHLDHLRDLAIPRVYAAGMECGEKTKPRYIFFIRRGVVHMPRDSGMTGGGVGSGGGFGAASMTVSDVSSQQTAAMVSRASYSLELPKNRQVLVEGHTYGESECIFGDASDERFIAVTHVDMYLLPFQVLIQLMKQVPEVQSTVYRSAQELSFLRDKEWPGTLFGPQQFGVELPNVHGIVPAQGLLANMASTPAAQNTDAQSMGKRCKRSSGLGLDPFGRRNGGGESGGATRRVTVFEEASHVGGKATGRTRASSTDAQSGGGLTGGRVSTALLTAMEQLPVVSLLPSFSADFLKECTQQWQCVTYTKGDVIVAAREECNRLHLFFEGRAGLVRSAAVLREELRPGLFGIADIGRLGPEVICPIPAGHVVGYTCVRRHRWTHSIVALDDVVEVWEMRRSNFVQLLRTHGMEREMQIASLQLLQPLAVQNDRLTVLDYQPLLHPMPNSLWRQQAVPNLYPVVATKEDAECFPIWREGNFPLDRCASLTDVSARNGSVGGRRSTLFAPRSAGGAAGANERQRGAGRRIGDSPKRSRQQSLSGVALSDSDCGARTSFINRLSSAA